MTPTLQRKGWLRDPSRATRFSRLTDRAVRLVKNQGQQRFLNARIDKGSGMVGCRGVLFMYGFQFDLGSFFGFEAFIF
jgi:hypothetical protein